MKNKKVLITGILGFIGSHLAEELCKDNTVVGIDNGLTGKIANIKGFESSIFLMNGDINNLENCAKLFSTYGPFDYIFHLAAVVGVKNTEEKPIEVLDDTCGINNILSLISSSTKVVFSSSSEVYGHTKPPLVEDGMLDIRTPYQVSKIYTEQMLLACAKVYQLPVTCVRYFNVFGPKQESSAYGFVTGIFINQMLQDKPATIYNDGNQSRDFTYIKDAVRLTIKSAEKTETDGEVINIGTGKKTTINTLADTLEKIIKPSNSDRLYLKERKDEIKHRHADVRKMKKLLGAPKYNLVKGLKETVRYYKEKK